MRFGESTQIAQEEEMGILADAIDQTSLCLWA